MNDYRQLSPTEAAQMLHAVASLLLPTVEAAQAEGREWSTIVAGVKAAPNDDTRLALYQLCRLDEAGWLDNDLTRRAAGLPRSAAAVLAGLLG